MDDKTSSHWPITLTNGLAAILNIFLPLGIVRILSPDQVGRYKIFFLYVLLSPDLFLTAGLKNGLYHWMGKYPQSKPELRQSWTLYLVVVLLFSALGLALAAPLAHLVKVAEIDFRAFILAMPFALAAAFMEDLLIARGDIWTGSWYSAGFSVLRTSTILAAAWWSRGVELVFWTFLAMSVLRALAGWMLLSKTGEVTPLFSMEKTSAVLRYAAPVSVAAFAGLGLSNIDQMILSVRLSAADFALYSIGCLSLPPLDILEISVNRILIPKMSRAFAAKDNAKAAALFSDAVSELWFFLLPATVGLVLFADPIILLLFTKRYAPAAHYLRYFAFSYLVPAIPHDAVARARGDGAWILRLTVLFAPFSLLTALWAAARWGAMGALISVLATTLLVRIYALMYNRGCFGLPYARFFPSRHLLTQVGIALAAAVVALALRPLIGSDLRWFCIAGPIFTAIYFSATYAVFLKNFDAAPAFFSDVRTHIDRNLARIGVRAQRFGVQVPSEEPPEEENGR